MTIRLVNNQLQLIFDAILATQSPISFCLHFSKTVFLGAAVPQRCTLVLYLFTCFNMNSFRAFCPFVFCLFAFCASFAQTFQPLPAPLLVREVAFEQATECTIFFENPSGAPLQLRWRSGEVSMPDGWDIDLCDYGLCYVGIPAGGTMNPISGSTQAYLKLIVQPDTIAGAGWLWFQVYEVGNNSNFLDVYFSLHTPGTSGTASPNQPAGLRIFPNPAHDVLFLENNLDIERTTARMLSVTGAVMWEGEIPAEQTTQINTSNWLRGVYFVQVGGAMKKVVLD